jgi:hypothetical protein
MSAIVAKRLPLHGHVNADTVLATTKLDRPREAIGPRIARRAKLNRRDRACPRRGNVTRLI